MTNALKTISNKSAPELSSIGYQLFKAAWKSQAPLILSLFNYCINFEHHLEV